MFLQGLTSKSSLIKTAIIGLSTVFSTSSFAHVGHSHGDHTNAFYSGLIHPITGLDHLIVLIGFGILAGFISTKRPNNHMSGKLIGAAIMSLLVGLISGRLIGDVASIETLIMGSLFVVSAGLWNVFSSREMLTKLLTTASIGLIFFHGFAHGVEATGSIILFTWGMLSSAAALMLISSRASEILTHKWAAIGIAASSTVLVFI